MSATGPNQGHIKTKRLYYTNKNIAGTAINEQVKIGYAVCFDYANAAPGESANRGRCVHKCETANANCFAGIVTAVNGLPTTSGGVVNGDAGWVEVAYEADSIEAWTHANMTVNTTVLKPTNGQWYLDAAATSALDTPAEIFNVSAVALETHDSSTTSANKRVRLIK